MALRDVSAASSLPYPPLAVKPQGSKTLSGHLYGSASQMSNSMTTFLLLFFNYQHISMSFFLNSHIFICHMFLAAVLNLKNHRFQEFKDQGGAGDTLVKLGLFVPWSPGAWVENYVATIHVNRDDTYILIIYI